MASVYGNSVSGVPDKYLQGKKAHSAEPFRRVRHMAGETLLPDPNFQGQHPKFDREERPDNA